MLLLREKEIRGLLGWLNRDEGQRLLTSLSKALAQHSTQDERNPSRQIRQPNRTVLVTKDGNTSLFMPVSDTANLGLKVVTVGTSGIKGTINIYAPGGELLGLLSAAEATAFRTALTTMTLFVRCALPKTHILVFGSGKQVGWHVRLALLLASDQIKSITVINRGRERLEELKTKVLAPVQNEHPRISIDSFAHDVPDYEERLRAALARSDAIFCCTPSTVPLFSSAQLGIGGGGSSGQKQRFISMIGSYKPHMREIDTPTLLSGGKVYVDSKEACLEESGELISAKLGEDDLIEIGELFDSKDSGSVAPEAGQNVVFKCVGMGLIDLVVGREILEIARNRGVGFDFDGLEEE